MALEGRYFVMKYALLLFNLLFWLSGLALIVIGATAFVKYGDFFSFANSKYANLPLIIMAIGVIIFIVSFLGCRGADKEDYCLLVTFATVLSVILVAIGAIAVMGFMYRKTVDSATDNALKMAVSHYNSNSTRAKGTRKILDWAQQNLKCCGGSGPEDFGNATCDGNPGVKSCYNTSSCTGKLYKVGCKTGFIVFVKNRLKLIAAVALGSTVIQVLGITLSCCLMKVLHKGYTEL